MKRLKLTHAALEAMTILQKQVLKVIQRKTVGIGWLENQLIWKKINGCQFQW